MTRLTALPSISARRRSRRISRELSTGEVVASAGIMNPQIRFGEDLMSRVSYVMMNPGGDKEMTASVREAINDLAEQVRREAQIDVERYPGCRLRRQSGHASSVARHRSDRARRRALRAGDRFRRSRGRHASSISSSIPARMSMCCPASPGMSVPTPRASCCRRARICPTTICSSSMSAPMRRSCSAIAAPAARLLLADRPRFRGRADLLRPARGARRHRARAHRSATRWSRATG